MDLDEIKLIEAVQFATIAHGNQKRKNTGIPYICHPLQVLLHAVTLSKYEFTIEEKIAIILHDVLEDTGVTKGEILRKFGKKVLTFVVELTDVSKKTGKPRRERKALDKKRMKECSVNSKRIKCYDIFSNVKDYLEEDPEYAKKYIKEKLLYLPCLKEAGDDYKFLKEYLTTVLDEITS